MGLRAKYLSTRIGLTIGTMSMAVLLALSGCSGSSSNGGGGGSTTYAAISGSVTSSVSSRRNRGAKKRPNTCASAACSTIVVGTGAAGPDCSVDSNGDFTLSSVPVGEQLEATFACTGGNQTCLIMSGDSGVTCDPVADAVIKAFLAEMGISNMGDASLAHANIAQIAHSIEQAAKTGTSAADTFLDSVSGCSSASCYLNAIKASPFFGPFRLMKTMVNGWDVESIYTLLTDVMGYQINLDSITYTSFGTRLDTWLGTDFIARTRTFTKNMLDDQTANGNSYVTQIVCSFNYSKYNGGGQIYYNPELATVNGIANTPSCKQANTSSGALTQNGLSPSQVTAINNAIDADAHSAIQLGSTSCSGPYDSNYFCAWPPQMVIKSKASEVNRNDPLGTNNNSFIQSENVSMINVFQIVMDTLTNATIPNDTTVGPNLGTPCMVMPMNGAPTVNDDTFCNNWFSSLFTADVKHGFAGVMGLYMALKNNSLGSNNLMSLNDIYTMFSSAGFFGTKLTNQSSFIWGIQYNQNGGGTNWIAALLNNPTPSAAYSGNYTLDPAFAAPNSSPITYTAAAALYNASTYGYNDSFKIFENIPTAEAVKGYVFKSSYHVDYNPTGNSTYWAAGGKVTPAGNTGGATADPIFCKMSNTSGPVEVDMANNPNITITCSDAATLGVSVDANGNLTIPDGFAYPYTLAQWGYQGDSRGSLFVLIDRKTGFQIRPNGREQYVYQQSPGNLNNVCDGAHGDVNTVVQTTMSMGNGNTMVDQLITAYCMDMSAFSTTNQLGFYWGGNKQISSGNPFCPSCTMGVSVVGGLNTNIANNWVTSPVCAFAATDSLTVANDVATSGAGGVVINGSGKITNLGDIIIDYCSVSHGGTTAYNLIAVNGWGATSTATLYAQFLPQTTGAKVLQWSAFPSTGGYNPTDYFLAVDAATLNNAFQATYSKVDHSYRVAPTAPPTQIQGISLANPSWQTKFDPYCDSVEGDGQCHCKDADNNPKSGNDCTLEDTPTDPTMSSSPYWIPYGEAPTKELAFFAAFGGKSGSQLVDNSNVPMSWSSSDWTGSGGSAFNAIHVNTQQAFVCKYLKTGETTYRRPTMMSNAWSHNQAGCPDVTGTINAYSCNNDCQFPIGATAATGGGPMRVVNPVPMNNAYAVLTPNAAVKLVNYATKDIGQGISVNPTEKLFTFDTALALTSFRKMFPLTGIHVTSSGDTIPGALGVFQRVMDPSLPRDSDHLDPVSSVLCYLSNGGTPCTNSSRFMSAKKPRNKKATPKVAKMSKRVANR